MCVRIYIYIYIYIYIHPQTDRGGKIDAAVERQNTDWFSKRNVKRQIEKQLRRKKEI